VKPVNIIFFSKLSFLDNFLHSSSSSPSPASISTVFGNSNKILLNVLMSSLCLFKLSNRPTLKIIFEVIKFLSNFRSINA